MKLIKPSFEILEQGYTLDDVYKHIELCGRTCYKSTDKITVDSAKPFVDRLIKSQHYAMLEHSTVYLHIPYLGNRGCISCKIANKYIKNKYSKVKEGYKEFMVTTNLRVIAENNWWNDLKYICEPTELHAKRHTVRFVCNRQVSHEFVRHRVFSFAQESTRYCNYTKDKFGNELTFIEPCWFRDKNALSMGVLISCLENVEKWYFSLVNNEWIAQEAATILPNALKTELIMTGFEDDWNHFFDLRARGTTGAPHPQAKELAEPLMNEFISRGWISE